MYTPLVPTPPTTFHLACAILHFLQGLGLFIALVIKSSTSVDIASYRPAFPLWNITSSIQYESNYNLGISAICLFMFTSGAHFFYYVNLKYYSSLQTMLDQGYNAYRWIEYSLSAPLMFVSLALLTGILDRGYLMALASNIFGLMYFGYVGEKTPMTLLTLVPWLMLMLVFALLFNQLMLGDPPNFVWALQGCLFLLFSSFGVVFMLPVSSYRKEMLYCILSLVSKTLLVWIPASVIFM